MKFVAALMAATAAVATAEPTALNLDNFESTLSGKNAIVKFLAPW